MDEQISLFNIPVGRYFRFSDDSALYVKVDTNNLIDVVADEDSFVVVLDLESYKLRKFYGWRLTKVED